MKINVHVFLGHGFFGFGLTPEQAIDSAVKEGMRKSHAAEGSVFRLPQGVTEANVDSMGYIIWKGPEEAATQLRYDKKTKSWVEPGAVAEAALVG